MPVHFPKSVLADLAVAIADGAGCISDLRALRDQPGLFGAVASKPTAWPVLDRVSPARLPLLRRGRAMARERAWAAGAGPDLSGEPFLDIDAFPVGSRVIVRKVRPYPGAQLSLFDFEAGLRHTAFICCPRPGEGRDEGLIAALELRHRGHARIEGRIRQAKAAGLSSLPCRDLSENEARLERVLAAADLVCWSKLLCFVDDPELARCEIASFRYRILHMAARIARSGLVISFRLDRTWAWSKQPALGFERLRAAFA